MSLEPEFVTDLWKMKQVRTDVGQHFKDWLDNTQFLTDLKWLLSWKLESIYMFIVQRHLHFENAVFVTAVKVQIRKKYIRVPRRLEPQLIRGTVQFSAINDNSNTDLRFYFSNTDRST